jgi:hypothetical protein
VAPGPDVPVEENQGGEVQSLRLAHRRYFQSSCMYNLQVLVAHTYNPSYLGGWDREDHGLRSAQANSSWDPLPPAKWTGGVAQEVEHLVHKHKALSSNPSSTKNKTTKWIYPTLNTNTNESAMVFLFDRITRNGFFSYRVQPAAVQQKASIPVYEVTCLIIC